MILDMCCGSRMFWFNKKHPDTVYVDIRNQEYIFPDRIVKIRPDIVADFRKLPFKNEVFDLVVFDPPHLKHAGPKSWLRAKYGVLTDNYISDISAGFSEAMRVLNSSGTLIFKWNSDQIPAADILEAIEFKPLFGTRTGRGNKTYWITFRKENNETEI